MENRQIYADVLARGAIISEYPPGARALQHHFPERNRIISGISIGVAVIEAPKKSGALITAARALEQGRDVFALPGNVDAFSCEGSNALLRDGAIPFLSADDIIDEYIELYPDKINTIMKNDARDTAKDYTPALKTETKKSFDNISKVDYIDLGNLDNNFVGNEKLVMESIIGKSSCIDEIILDTSLPAQKVLAVLTMLEIGGHIQRDNTGRWESAI